MSIFFPKGLAVYSAQSVDVKHHIVYRLNHIPVTRCLSRESPFLTLTSDLSPNLPVSEQQERINQSPCKFRYMRKMTIVGSQQEELQSIPWRDGDLLHTLITFWHSPENASQPQQVSFPWRKTTNLSSDIKETEYELKCSTYSLHPPTCGSCAAQSPYLPAL